jgi:CRISPR-associated protein Csm5
VSGDLIVVVDIGKALDTAGAAAEDGRIAAAIPADDLNAAKAYTLPFAGGGLPRSILPTAKDVDNKAYLPGSELKGGLRTLISQKLLRDEAAGGTQVRVQTTNDFGRRIPAQFAGQQIERRIFGEQPRDNAVRAIRVSDLSSGDVPLAVAPARTYSREEHNLSPGGERRAVEVIPPGARLIGSLTLDRYLLEVSRGVQNGAAKELVKDLVGAGQDAARSRISAERENVNGAGRVASFYEALGREAESPAENSFLIQLGWGAGYDSKSFGPALKNSPDWNSIREQYFAREQRRGPRDRQGGPPRPGQGGRRNAAREFPSSRRFVELGGTAELPFGWVRVTLVPASEALPEQIEPPVTWRNEPFPEGPRPAAAAAAAPGQPAAEAQAAVLEPVSPFARLQALLGGPETEAAPSEAAPMPPIPRVSDRNLKPGTILEAEIVEVQEKQLVVDLGREHPTAVDAAVLGGGNLTTRFNAGQRIRLRVLNAPPFFKVRLA